MTLSPSRDVVEQESLSPSQKTSERRRFRDNEVFRAWCEESFGMVMLGSEALHPADILERLAPGTAQRGRYEAVEQALQDIERAACDHFPALIAIPPHRFLEGNRDPLYRLNRLRDIWESLVRLLAAITLAEAAASGTRLEPLTIRESISQVPRNCKRKDLRSERLAVRIGLIEAVLLQAQERDIQLEMRKLLPADIVDEMRRLNSIRNEFSHEATKSERQAEKIVGDAYPDVREVLLDLRSLQDLKLFRVRKIQPSSPHPIAEIELLHGNSLNQRISDLDLERESSEVLMSASKVGNLDRVVAQVGRKIVDISPFVYATDDSTGHRTRLLEFKRQHNFKWHLECVGESITEEFEEEPHVALLARYYRLVSGMPEDEAP